MDSFNMLNKRCVIFGLIIILAVILRLTWLDRFPPSLYTDEANQGYNAYSILHTLKDEHGKLLPLSLRSFGDWKPPLQTYLMIPFIQIFGLNEIAVRFPSAVLGIMTIIFTFFILRLLFAHNNSRTKLALLASFYLAISPWHILQCRSAMLVIVALFFFEGGILFFLTSLKKKWYIVLSSGFFVMSLYSYYGLRVITPLMILFLLIYYRRELMIKSKEYLMAVFIGFVLLLPLFISAINEPDVILGRARTVSIFYDQGVKLSQWELFSQDGVNYPTLISRFFHNNVYMYGKDIIKRYLSHFDGRYLFLIGDTAQPFQIPNMGILYFIDFIFLLMGMYSISQIQNRSKWLIIACLLISFIPASLTFMTPTSNRTFNAVIPLAVIIAFGIVRATVKQRNWIPGVIITLIYLISFSWFLRQYFITLPIQNASWWNWGWREVVQYSKGEGNKYDNIVVSDVNGMPYIYFLFYGKYDPNLYQKEAIRTLVADRFGFEHVEGFGKYIFPSDFNWKYVKENIQPKTLYIVPIEQAKLDNQYLYLIKYPDNSEAFKIFGYEN